ncbi:eukaryotic translation initiation factor 5B-like [Chelonus insularis]|uniref:eukaryotic translation initiation factor 5B-like n=1 Tax=Chelonus insularis TaxID=460826 RepID=UPI00158E8985|nr:eukaryotic translation initiation factor 5B-like [Chelonus insularis]
MATEAKNNRIYVNVELFKGDFCARLSPDLLQQREIYTQTDDESSSECSAHSADTILQESQNNLDGDELLLGNEKIDKVNSLSLHVLSSEEDNHESSKVLFASKNNPSTVREYSPLLVNHNSNPVNDSFSSIEENSCTFTDHPSTSKNKSTSKDCSPTPVKNSRTLRSKTSKDRSLTPVKNPTTSIKKCSSRNSIISSSEEVIPPSPIHSIISSDSTISMKSTKQKSKKNRRKIIDLNNDDSTDHLSDNESVNKQRTVQRPTKKNKSSTTKKTNSKKPQPKGKKKIVMNKVVYPSSYPTSAEESLSDDSLIMSSKTTRKPVSSKLLVDKKTQNKNLDIISLSEDDS